MLAAEQLRGVFAELSVVTTRRTVGLHAPWTRLGEAGYDPGPETTAAVGAAIGELRWWAETLRPARLTRPLPR